jgi:serine phosphatase RsbU (regulator of sigma subunit)
MKYLIIVLFLSIVNSNYGNTNDVATLENKVYISKNCQIIEDQTSALKLKEVLLEDFSWQPIEQDIPYLDFTTSKFWVQFSISNSSNNDKSIYLETARPLTNTVNLHQLDSTGENVENSLFNGDDLPFSKRDVQHQNMVFPIKINAGQTVNYLLEVKSDGETLSLPVVLWDRESFANADGDNRLLTGAYYGILFFIIIIYFFFYLALKLKSFLYYVFYVANLLLFQLSIDGFAFQYLWPNSPWMGNHAIIIFVCSTAFVLITYGKEFLQLKEHSKILLRISNVLLVLISTCFLISIFSESLYKYCFPFVNAMSFIAMLVILGSVILLIKRKVDISIFFLLAFVALICGAALFVLGNTNVIKHNFITEYGIKLGSAIEVVFLSIAMAGKYRQIQQEKESAQEQSLKRLEEMNELKDQINVRLEKQVTERTLEIENQKKVLEVTNKEITDSIHYAQKIQYAIMPAEVRFKTLLPESFILFKPKDIVSGDFYWVAERGNLVYYLAGDCTGHGVPGAFMSLINTILLDEAMTEKIQLPGDILRKVRLGIVDTLNQKGGSLSQKDGMDAALCAVDYKNKMLYYAGANNPLYLVREVGKIDVMLKGQILEPTFQTDTHRLYQIKGDKKPVGYSDHSPDFRTRSFKLEFGDTLYTFSDGYADQFGGQKGKKFMYKQLREILLGFQGERLSIQKELLETAFEEWRGNLSQVDDVCIIGVRV